MKILVVDDNNDVRHVVVQMLKAAGHEVIATDDGWPGMTLALSEHPDWIVTDMSMLFMDGDKMIKLIREQWKEAKFIAMSASPRGWDLPEDVVLLEKPSGLMRLEELIN